MEPKLIQPTFVMDYPIDMSPLAKQKEGDPSLAEEVRGIRRRNGDSQRLQRAQRPEEQERRFGDQEEWRVRFQEEETERTDADFLEALAYGMPPTGGLGVGIDRLVMLLTGQATLRDALLFPQMRSIK